MFAGPRRVGARPNRSASQSAHRSRRSTTPYPDKNESSITPASFWTNRHDANSVCVADDCCICHCDSCFLSTARIPIARTSTETNGSDQQRKRSATIPGIRHSRSLNMRHQIM
jgi:hypothetical protein